MTETRQSLPLERFLLRCELNGLCQHRRKRERERRDKLNFQHFFAFAEKSRKNFEST